MNSVPTNAQSGPTTGQEATSDLATKTIGDIGAEDHHVEVAEVIGDDQ